MMSVENFSKKVNFFIIFPDKSSRRNFFKVYYVLSFSSKNSIETLTTLVTHEAAYIAAFL
jgi:hypothetical protein